MRRHSGKTMIEFAVRKVSGQVHFCLKYHTTPLAGANIDIKVLILLKFGQLRNLYVIIDTMLSVTRSHVKP